MHFDAPYGYELFPHDQQITASSLSVQSRQFDAINTQTNHVWMVMHKPEDTNIVIEAMIDRSYKNISHFFWHKPNQYVEGPPNRLTPVVEMGTIGCIPDANSIHTNMSSDPRQRPNMVSVPSLTTLTKDTAGNIINPCEKPPGLGEWLFKTFCPKGSTVLIIGTGAGGDLKGAVLAGMNVIGVENDEKQFKQLQSEMNAWVANLAKEKKKEQGKSIKQATDQSLSPAKGSKKPKDKEGPEPVETVLAETFGACFACDEKEKDGDPLVKCATCDKFFHTVACLEDRPAPKGGGEAEEGRICSGCVAELYPVDVVTA
jgi:hypothetical protein